jgi:hypothetical protein
MRRRHLETEHRHAVRTEAGVSHRPGQRNTAEQPSTRTGAEAFSPPFGVARSKSHEGVVHGAMLGVSLHGRATAVAVWRALPPTSSTYSSLP